MRVAVMADIHGNLPALEAALEDAEAQAADRIVINGDMVNRGPDNEAVMAVLAERGYAMTLGNHDDLMRMWVDRDLALPVDWYDDPFWAGTGWCAERLASAGWIESLRGLPLMLRLEVEDAPTVLVSHGSPRHYREGYGRFLSDEAISEITHMHPADVLVGSHTHFAMERRWGRYHVINTGSVGAPFNGDPRAQYLFLNLSGGRWVPEFRRVPYDRERALRAFVESAFLEEGGLSARIFYEELRCARSLLTPFLMWTEEQGQPRDEGAWARFRASFPERFLPPGQSA